MSGKTASTGCGSSIESSLQRGHRPIRLPGPIAVLMGFREIRERNGDRSAVLGVSTTNCSARAAGLSLGVQGAMSRHVSRLATPSATVTACSELCRPRHAQASCS
jgi:hypothetical protein